jgi:hypothetical protein
MQAQPEAKPVTGWSLPDGSVRAVESPIASVSSISTCPRRSKESHRVHQEAVTEESEMLNRLVYSLRY